MGISPLRGFVLTAAFWLPAMFFVWFALSSAVVFPSIRVAALLMSVWMPDLVLSLAQDYHHAVYAFVADVSGVSGLPASRLAVEEQRTNVLIYSYGLPLLFGLIMATPLNWRRTFLQLGIGLIVMTGIQVFGLVGNMLNTMAFGVGPAVQAALSAMDYAAVAPAAGAAATQHMLDALAGHGLSSGTLIALLYQFGYLVLPAVTPVALWILMNPRFLETLVGWREPEAASPGPTPSANSGGGSA
jgi:hypothetical protein